jgi:hypothetical protein
MYGLFALPLLHGRFTVQVGQAQGRLTAPSADGVLERQLILTSLFERALELLAGALRRLSAQEFLPRPTFLGVHLLPVLHVATQPQVLQPGRSLGFD